MNDINPEEKDIMGEVGNISMSTAATTLSTLLGKTVHITTPQIQVTTFDDLEEGFTTPYVLLEVSFQEGLHGTNALLMSAKDASVIANVMMGGDGSALNAVLSEIELSAVSEAMNQMIGSASTTISTLLERPVKINPPVTRIWEKGKEVQPFGISGEEVVVKIAFRLAIEGLIDSEIMQLYTMETTREISRAMAAGLNQNEEEEPAYAREPAASQSGLLFEEERREERMLGEGVRIQKPVYAQLAKQQRHRAPRNIDLILDVPLELSVVLGRTQKSIKDILAFEPGSIIELNKLAEEPLEIYVNGKHTAQGEVVVVDEKFGIRITNILSPAERVQKLG